MKINTNKPFTTSQVSNEKPNVARSDNKLDGYIANSFNGGHNRTIAWKQVMAGERHKEYVMHLKIRTLTPLTPPYQQLKCTIRSYFVPNSRVWENAEKFTAQKGGSSEIKIKEIPHIGGQDIPYVLSDDNTQNVNLMNTVYWRNGWISSYIPRMGTMEIGENADDNTLAFTLPKISALPLRGRIAIYNDFERNKEYDVEIQEFKSDRVSFTEFQSYLPYGNIEKLEKTYMRAKRSNNYYSNYRTEIQGFEEEYPPNDMSSDTSLISWGVWEHKIAEARSEAENAQKNDWEIISEIRGSKLLSEGKVQLIGERVFNLNYASVTQNAYNSSDQVQSDEFKVLGQQGAYSYTEISLPVYAGIEFKEEGYVHIIATVSAESVFESGIDRLELNVNALDQYRPDLINEKHDVLYKEECDTTQIKAWEEFGYNVLGFKRKFSEYFKLPNIISGDLMNHGYFQEFYQGNDVFVDVGTESIPKSSYQFFEYARETDFTIEGMVYGKNTWQDYTDLLINKNLAIMQRLTTWEGQEGRFFVYVDGDNQIDLVGKCELRADMPIDEAIKNNFTKWGEH